MSERAFGKVITPGANETIDVDVNLPNFSPPFTITILPRGQNVTRTILGLVNETESEIVAAGAVVADTPSADHVVDQAWNRLRIRIAAGATPPTSVEVQVNGERD